MLATTASLPDVYVVFREDLPEGEPTHRALADGFGAETGDEVVEVKPGGRPGELVARRWAVSGAGERGVSTPRYFDSPGG